MRPLREKPLSGDASLSLIITQRIHEPTHEAEVMISPHPRFLVDEDGRRTAVLIDIEEYKKLLAELEELESIRAYDQAKSSGDEAIPFEDAVNEIEEQQ